MNTIASKLDALHRLININSRTGCTTARIHGVQHNDKALLVTLSEDQAQTLPCRAISLERALVGQAIRRTPLVFDNHAIDYIVLSAIEHIQNLEKENKELLT